MRTWGRRYDLLGNATWVEVTTDPRDGSNDAVYVTALIQSIKLNPGESPFYADWGVPGLRSVQTQIYPDYWMALMQQRYAPRFASLQITKLAAFEPTYNVDVLTHQGVRIAGPIAV